MGADIDASDLEATFEDFSREKALELANKWYSFAAEDLTQAGDEHDYDVFPVVNSGIPPQWDEGRGGAVFRFPHKAAHFFEDGTDPHPIEPTNAEVLAFPWPEMEGVEFGDTGKTFDEVFESSWPTVFLPKVEVDGIPALKFMESGRADAIRTTEGVEPR